MKLKLSNPLSLSTALALATIGLGSFSSAAQAAGFNFSYTLQNGDVLSGMLDGDVQPDGDTVIVNSVSMAQFNGVAGPDLPFVSSVSFFFFGLPVPPIVSFSGTVMDLLAASSIEADDFFFFDTNGLLSDGVPLYFSSDSFGGIEPYNSANWSLTAKAVPEPSTMLMLGASAAVAFGTGFKRRLTKTENKK